MEFLGKPGGQYAIRLVKPPFDAEPREYFHEYEELTATRSSESAEKFERYIVPENTSYAIELTLKKGFDFGDYIGVYLVLQNHDGTASLGMKQILKNASENVLTADKIFLVDSVDCATVNGSRRDGALLSFCELAVEEKPSDEIDFDSFPSSMLGDFRITVEKCTATYKKKVSNEELEKFMIEYEIHMKQIPRTIDEKISEKQGITHITETRGGEDKGAWNPPTRMQNLYSFADRVISTYRCRSKAYISVKGYSLHKAPILLECYQWEALTEPERVSSFKILQAYDKAHTLQQRIAEAGPGADKNAIQRELLELGEVPNRWRAWGNLYKREREGLFCELQRRRNFFEKGEYPPDEPLPDNPKKTASSFDEEPATKDRVKEEPVENGDITPAVPECDKSVDAVEPAESAKPCEFAWPVETTDPPVLMEPIESEQSTEYMRPVEAVTIKEEPFDDLAAASKTTQKPIVIVLDDSDDDVPPPRGAKRAAPGSIPTAQPTIKPETIDLEASHSPIPSESPLAKKIKLEPETKTQMGIPTTSEVSPEPPQIEEDPELLRLREENEREEEELAAAQRVADLIKKRNERKARIATLEARNSPAPSHS